MKSEIKNKDIFTNSKFFLENTWNTFLVISSNELGKRITDNWFRSLKLNYWNSIEKTIEILAPNEFISKWISQNYKENIEKIFLRIFGEKNIIINIVFEKIVDNNSIKPAILLKKNETEITKKKYNLDKKNLLFSKLSPENNFESFIYDNSNEIAFFAAKYFSEKNEIWYNPLFIYGPSGIGKTHLIQSIANYFLEKNSNFIYQTADIFIQNYIQSVKSNTIDQFEKSYQNIDVFLLDDIQAIQKKPQTQEILLKIIINFQLKQKKIIITSDSLPNKIKGLVDRLRSRFEGGLIVDLKIPSHETLIKITINKAKKYKINLCEESASFIASSIKKSIREVEGVLIKLSTYASITKKELTFNLITEIISNFNSYYQEEPFVQKIINFVSKKFNVSFDEIKFLNRKKNISISRHLIMYLLRKYTCKSLKQICTILNRSDHTTVIYAQKKITKLKEDNPDFNKIIFSLESEIEKYIDTKEYAKLKKLKKNF